MHRRLGACQQPAMQNGRCRLHGGKSTGPWTTEGIERIQQASLKLGRRTKVAAQLGFASAHNPWCLRNALLVAEKRCQNRSKPTSHSTGGDEYLGSFNDAIRVCPN